MKQIGRYEVVEKIGRGAMGEVYKAVLHGVAGFQKLVALKVLHPLRMKDMNLKLDLVREAKIGAVLHHPNLVETFEMGEDNSCLYIAMELVEGMSLRKLLNDVGALSKRTSWEISMGILKGLSYAHQVQFDGTKLFLIHRDLKPSNILLAQDGTPKITDFGLARAQGISDQTHSDIRGTPAYMSPEQVEGLELTMQSDLFSVGLIMYEMVIGKRLFSEFSPVVSMLKIADIDSFVKKEDWDILTTKNPEMAPIIRKMLQKDVNLRYTNALEILQDLRKCKNQDGHDPQSLIQHLLIQQHNQSNTGFSGQDRSTSKIMIDEDESFFQHDSNLISQSISEVNVQNIRNQELQQQKRSKNIDTKDVFDDFEDEECTEIDSQQDVVPQEIIKETEQKIKKMFGRNDIFSEIQKSIAPQKIIWIHGQKGIGKSLLLQNLQGSLSNVRFVDTLSLQDIPVSSKHIYDLFYRSLLQTTEKNALQQDIKAVNTENTENFIKRCVQQWCTSDEKRVVILDSLSVQYYPIISKLCSISPNISWIVGALSCPILSKNQVYTEIFLLPPLSKSAATELILSCIPESIESHLIATATLDSLHFSDDSLNISEYQKTIQECLQESHGIPFLLIQNAAVFYSKSKDIHKEHFDRVRENYFNEIQIRFEQQSYESQQVFIQSAIIESHFDLDTVESIVIFHTNRSNYWLIDALEELLRSSFLSLQEHHFFIPPLLRRFAKRFLTTEIRLKLQLHHAQHFSQYAFIPYANHNFDIDAFMKKRNDIEKDIQVALENSMHNKWNSLSANLGLALGSIWYRQGPLPKGISLLERVLALPLTNREQATLLALLGNYGRHFGQYEFSISQLQQSLKLFETLDDQIGIMETTRNLALSYADYGDFVKSQTMLDQAFHLVQELNIPFQKILYYKEKGWILSQMGQADKALEILYETLVMFPQNRHFLSRSQIHSNIGLIYFRKNQIGEAARQFNKALNFAKHGNVLDRMGLVSLNIALCSILRGDTKLAETAFRQGARQLQKIQNYRGLATLLANLSLFRLTQGKINSAKEYAKRSTNLCTRFPHSITEYLLAFIRTLLSIEAGDIVDATTEIFIAKELVKRKQVTYKFAECYAICVEVFALQNRWKEAQEHFEILQKGCHIENPSDSFFMAYAKCWLLKETGSIAYHEIENHISQLHSFVREQLPNRPDIDFLIRHLKTYKNEQIS